MEINKNYLRLCRQYVDDIYRCWSSGGHRLTQFVYPDGDRSLGVFANIILAYFLLHIENQWAHIHFKK